METITCEECGAEFDIQHNEMNKVLYCPFCGEVIQQNEDFDEWAEDQEFWDEEDE